MPTKDSRIKDRKPMRKIFSNGTKVPPQNIVLISCLICWQVAYTNTYALFRHSTYLVLKHSCPLKPKLELPSSNSYQYDIQKLCIHAALTVLFIVLDEAGNSRFNPGLNFPAANASCN